MNQVAKSMACDLRERKIAVVAIAPGMLVTEFGPGPEMMTKFGAKPVEQGVPGILKVLNAVTVETTGEFWVVPTSGDEPKIMPW